MEIELECTYCGSIWSEIVYSDPYSIVRICLNCKDTNVKIVKKLDYYQDPSKIVEMEPEPNDWSMD
jgi:hypothetical protein